jgi:hypothetical protein
LKVGGQYAGTGTSARVESEMRARAAPINKRADKKTISSLN